DISDADPLGYRFRDRSGVPRDHGHAYSESMQLLDGFPPFIADTVLDGQRAEYPSVCDDKEHRFALAAPHRGGLGYLRRRRRIACRQKIRSADRDHYAIDKGLRAATRQRFEGTRSKRSKPASFRFGNDDF